MSNIARVLVAEDEAQIRELCSGYLNRFNYETALAADGESALSLAMLVLPDIILLDVNMPGLSGLEVCRTLKSRHATQHIPIILMTGLDQPEDVVIGLQAGADDYVCKPLRMAELKVRMDNLLRRKQMFDMLQAHNEELVETLGNQSRAITELFTLSLQMNKAQTLEDLLNVLTNGMARIMSCRRVTVLLPDRRQGVLRARAGFGIPTDNLEQIRIASDNLALLEIFSEGQPTLLHPNEPLVQTLLGGSADNLRIQEPPLAVIPLVFAGEPVGIIMLNDRLGGLDSSFSPTDVTMLTYVAQVAGIALKNRLRQLQVRETQDVTILALARLAESRDHGTGNHLKRVQTYCRRLAEQLQANSCYRAMVTREFIDELSRAAPLHDIGKVGISDNILLKPGKLSPEERRSMEEHTVLGGQTLEYAESMTEYDSFLSMAKEICYCHHEKWDGSGYPHGLKGLSIPLSARIIAVADVYDALTTCRPYKAAFPHEKSVAIISEGRGSHFDPIVVDCFLQLVDEFDLIRSKFSDRQAAAPADQGNGFAAHSSTPSTSSKH